MKLIIDIDEDRYDKNYLLVKNGMGDDVHRAVANGTPIPDNATNGDVITAMFPNATIVEMDLEVFLYTRTREKDEDVQIFDTEWWNSQYLKGGANENKI